MKEVYLYACDVCSTVRMECKSNKSTMFVWCQVCKECQFHNKIVIGYRPPKDGEKNEIQVIFVLEEKKNADSNAKDDKEGKAHVD